MSINKIMERKDIEQKYKWDIDDIYNSKEELIRDREEVKKLIDKIAKYKGNLTRNGDNLYNCLKLSDEAGIICDRIYVSASMKRDEDTSNPESQELSELGEKLSVELRSATSFISPEIIEAGEDRINALLMECRELELYKHNISDLLRQKEHYLSAAEESILAQSHEIASGYQNTFRMLNGVDMKLPKAKDGNGKEHELTNASFSLYLQSPDRELRKNSFEALYGKYKEFKNTYGAIYSGNVKKDVFYSKIRKYNSSLEAALFSDNIPKELYHNLIDSVGAKIDLLDLYCKTKKSYLKLDELHLYDLYAPMVSDIEKDIDFESAKAMVMEALSVLGKDYLSILEEAFNNRWIDVYENPGKRSGAYSWGSYDTKPYILLNYKNSLKDVLTLAHELGHSIHSYYSKKNQPYVYANYTIFCAEVASTTNECIMYLYLMEKLKGNERKYLVSEFLESIRTIYYRQTMFAEFEMIVHDLVENGEPINGERLNRTWKELYQKYYGRECILDEGIEMEWARIPHFYNSFYVYKYVTGLSAAISIAKNIIDDNKNIEKYLEFLRSGSTDYSINLLRKAGVDMTTSKPLNDTAEMFKYLLNELNK